MDLRVLTYLPIRIVSDIASFLNHWYVRSLKNIMVFLSDILSELERSFAVKVNLRHLFSAMYQDKSLIGYFLGFLFRSIRVIVGILVYAVIIIILFLFYAAWVLAPLFLIYKIITSLYA